MGPASVLEREKSPVRDQAQNQIRGHQIKLTNELPFLWVKKLVGNNEGKQSDGLAGPGRHFKETVTPRVQRPLEISHVGILLRVYVFVRENDRKVVEVKPGRGTAGRDL